MFPVSSLDREHVRQAVHAPSRTMSMPTQIPFASTSQRSVACSLSLPAFPRHDVDVVGYRAIASSDHDAPTLTSFPTAGESITNR